MDIEMNTRPRLAAGCRLNDPNRPPRMLQMPERVLRLNGPSLEIVTRCDGKHTVQQIVSEMQKLYSKAEPERVEKDILGYLSLLHDKRALDFTVENSVSPNRLPLYQPRSLSSLSSLTVDLCTVFTARIPWNCRLVDLSFPQKSGREFWEKLLKPAYSKGNLPVASRSREPILSNLSGPRAPPDFM